MRDGGASLRVTKSRQGVGRVFFPQLEALRGLAAATVVIFHVLQSGYGLEPNSWDLVGSGTVWFLLVAESMFNGGAAVVLFFVLSGFVMGVNVDTSESLSVGLYSRFLLRRFFRLIPMIIVAVGLAIAIREIAFGDSYTARQILRFVGLRDVSINAPLWSLRVEIVASLIYPILL